MDLGYGMDAPVHAPSGQGGPTARAAAFLAAGGRAVVITGPSQSGKRRVLEMLLAGMAGRVTRVANHSGRALALAGVLEQMGQVAESEADERGLFFRTLAEQAYDDYSAVVAVEDAHTLTGFALAALARVPGLGGPEHPGMILVLTGEPSLIERLGAPGLEVLRNPRRSVHIELPGAAGVVRPIVAEASSGASMPRPGAAALPVGWARGTLGFRAVVIAVLAGAVAAAGGITWSVLGRHRAAPVEVASLTAAAVAPPSLPPSPPKLEPEQAPSVVAEIEKPAPAPGEAGPATLAPAVAATPDAAAPGAATTAPAAEGNAPTDVAALPPPQVASVQAQPVPALSPEALLRQEFDVFLDHAGKDTAKLTPAARETLFREYRKWRARNATEARAP